MSQVIHVVGPGKWQATEVEFSDRATPAQILRELEAQKKTFGRVGTVVKPDDWGGRLPRTVPTNFPDPASDYVWDDSRTVVKIVVREDGGFREIKRLKGPPEIPPPVPEIPTAEMTPDHSEIPPPVPEPLGVTRVQPEPDDHGDDNVQQWDRGGSSPDPDIRGDRE